MKYSTCLRCHRKISSELSQKRGYGPTCYKKYLAEKTQPNLSIASAKYNYSFRFAFNYRKEGFVNCAKLFTSTQVKPVLTLNTQSENSLGTYRVWKDEISIKTKFENQFGKIETYAHELVHATKHSTRMYRSWDREQIRGKSVDVREEMIAEIGSYLILKRCHVFQDSYQADRFLSHQLARIRECHLDYLESWKQTMYISELPRMYKIAENVVNYLFEGL